MAAPDLKDKCSLCGLTLEALMCLALAGDAGAIALPATDGCPHQFAASCATMRAEGGEGER